MTTFEALYAAIRDLPVPATEDQRQLAWCGTTRRIALAKLSSGGVEVFVVGPKLRARLAIVDRHMNFGPWQTEGGRVLSANRIVLPADPHFVPVSAFLAEELLRHGIEDSPARAFSECEPVIEMALRGSALAEETVLGLIGELLLLEALLKAARGPESRAECIEAWRGFERTSRDFLFETKCVIEVKATRSESSKHHIHNISQVDPLRSADGAPVEQLYLVSVGLAPAEEEMAGAFALPDLVDRVLRVLGPKVMPGERNEIQELLLSRIGRYGGRKDRGYVHDDMRGLVAYSGRWVTEFQRSYDMNDSAVAVLRRSDLLAASYVHTQSVSFEVSLPESISDQNPRSVGELAAELASDS